MLSLFTLALLCTYAFTTDLSLQLSTSLTSKGFILNTLRPNESIYSRNEKFKLTMNENCNLVLKRVKGKILWTTGLNGKFINCRAVLKGDSNFEVISERGVTLWSTRTSLRFANSRNYRLTVLSDSNIMVKNKKGECVWALFGCPLPKNLVKKINSLGGNKAIIFIQKFIKIVNERRKGLPTKPLPIANNKPVIKFQIPAVLKPVKPKPIIIKPIIGPKIFEKLINDKINGIRKIINRLRGLIKDGKTSILIKLIKGGTTYNELKRKAIDSINKKIKQFKNKEKFVSPKINLNFKTKKVIFKKLDNTSWMKFINNGIKRGLGYNAIKKYIKNVINFRGGKKIWKKIKIAIKKKDSDKFKKIIFNPPKVIIKIPKIDGGRRLRKRYSLNFPAKKKWVLRFKTYRTFYWRYFYNYNYWVNHCYGRWFWRRCIWLRHARLSWYQHWYWTSIPYWSWE